MAMLSATSKCAARTVSFILQSPRPAATLQFPSPAPRSLGRSMFDMHGYRILIPPSISSTAKDCLHRHSPPRTIDRRRRGSQAESFAGGFRMDIARIHSNDVALVSDSVSSQRFATRLSEEPTAQPSSLNCRNTEPNPARGLAF